MKVVACGRRWGKTALGLLACVDGHGPLEGPGGRPLHTGAWDGGKIWWVVPDYPTAAEVWRDLKHATRDGRAHKDEVGRRIELHSGGSVTVKSAHDPEALVAVGLDGAVIDEAAKIAGAAWDFLRPTLADRRGWAIFISTPKGFNWFYEKWEYAAAAPGWARWQQPSSANPLMTAGELAQAREDASRLYGQEYEARFEQPEGAEWPPGYFPDSLWFSDFPADPVLSVLAADPSLGKGEKKHGCFAVIVYAALDRGGKLWVEAWASQAWDGGRLGELLAEHADRLRPTSVLYEGNGGQSFLGPLVLRLCRERGFEPPLEEVTHTQVKEERIRGELTPRLRRFEFRFRDTPGTRTLINQCREFPVGEFVDGPDALAMASAHVQTLLRRRKGRGKP